MYDLDAFDTDDAGVDAGIARLPIADIVKDGSARYIEHVIGQPVTGTVVRIDPAVTTRYGTAPEVTMVTPSGLGRISLRSGPIKNAFFKAGQAAGVDGIAVGDRITIELLGKETSEKGFTRNVWRVELEPQTAGGGH